MEVMNAYKMKKYVNNARVGQNEGINKKNN